MTKFKPGQLVQSVKYGAYYVVEHVFRDGTVIAAPLVMVMYDKLYFEPDRLRLVGNNYRSIK